MTKLFGHDMKAPSLNARGRYLRREAARAERDTERNARLRWAAYVKSIKHLSRALGYFGRKAARQAQASEVAKAFIANPYDYAHGLTLMRGRRGTKRKGPRKIRPYSKRVAGRGRMGGAA